MKQLYKTSLIIYVVFLLWLILFKTSSEPLSVLANYQSRSFNLLPLISSLREAIDNFIVFIPLGMLLSINFTNIRLWQKSIWIFAFSVTLEATQFVFAIGTSDITDVITNTTGGLFGLGAYALVSRYVDNKKLNIGILAVLAILLVAFVLLRFFVFKVRY